MRRQLGDLIAQSVQFRDGSEGGADGCRVDFHGEPPSTGATLHPGFGATLERSGRAMRARAMILVRSRAAGLRGARPGRWAVVS